MANPTQYLKDYQPPHFSIESTYLTFDIQPHNTIVTNTMKLQKVDTGNQQPLVLNGENQQLLEVKLNDKCLSERDYQVGQDQLTIANVPDQFELTITSQIIPEKNTTLMGLYHSNGIYCSQCEPHGFHRITYYLDRPDVMTTFTTKIIADQKTCPVLLSNGNLVEQGHIDQQRHFAIWQDPHKKPSYLFALVAGDLAVNEDQFTTQSGRQVALKIYTHAEDIDKTAYAMFALKSAMAWDEQTYGLEYDLDIFMIVAVHDFNMGAMENKGLNVFNSKYVLADPKTATDADYEAIYTVIGHEYFHNWTGNRVTCRDWFQLSLKEGLTVFRDQSFTQQGFSSTVKRIEQVNVMRSAQFSEDASPMAHPIRPISYQEMNNFYTATVYDKGAEVIRMQHTLVGEQGFRKGMDLYFQRHDGQAVTCDDFVDAIADANDVNWQQFKRWYNQAGTPIVSVTDHYDVQERVYTLTIKQHCPPTADQSPKLPLYIPIRTGLIGQDGTTLSTCFNESNSTEHVLLLKDAQQSFRFEQVEQQPTPSLLRDFSAPVKVDFDYSIDQLIQLLKYDSNEFNRWDASQTLAKVVINQLIHQIDHGKTLSAPAGYIDALRHTLLSQNLDQALISAALTLPTVFTLAEDMPTIRVDQLVEAHQWLKRHIANELQTEFEHVFKQNHHQDEYQFTAEAIAKRCLQNTCLNYLSELDNVDVTQYCQHQFTQANNMTDQFAAFRCLINQTDNAAFEQAVDTFYQQWQQNDLVIDKWLTAQALSKRPGTLQRVQQLTKHPAYNCHTPNKVYALILGFTRNMPHFHHIDGSGYRFIADQIIKMDAINPQVAARLVKQLMSWQRYDQQRQQLMKSELERISQQNLSSDVYEIVEKSLKTYNKA